jgi:hypothetical protein
MLLKEAPRTRHRILRPPLPRQRRRPLGAHLLQLQQAVDRWCRLEGWEADRWRRLLELGAGL